MEDRRSNRDGSPLTRNRAADKDAEFLQRGFRRTMKRKPPNSKLCWAEILAEALCYLVRNETISPELRMKAIRTAIEINGGVPANPVRVKTEESEAAITPRDPLQPLPEEESLSDEELDRQIAELQSCLGSISTGSD